MNPKARLSLLLFCSVLVLNFQNCANPKNFEASSGDGILENTLSSTDPDGSSTDPDGSTNPDNTGPLAGGGAGTPETNLPDGSPGSKGGGEPSTCTVPPSQITKSMKILFVVDTSGSNVTTDRTKSFRNSAVQKFLDSYRAKRNFQWQFITFGGTSATSYLKSPTSAMPNFTSEPNQMDNALTAFKKITDVGSTPYLKAFNEISTNITNDPDRMKSGDPANYVVVFLSDGVPSDVSTTFKGTTWETNAKKLLNLAPNRLTLSAVYYGQKNSKASTQMSAMATAMGGQFVDTNVAGYNFNVQDIVNVPGGACD